MNEKAQKELHTLVEQITNTNQEVVKVILFGSYAYGSPNEDSDFDLCVLVNDTVENVREIRKQIHLSLYEIMETPIDLMVYQVSKFKARASNVVTLEYKIDKEGVVLHGEQ
ncbi:nucleotidyltransferase domain-containing protein [Bacillus paranthracis]|uniref:nucleotidyltransferase domain-containing protein n=1 Tax=Bacillus paranthracis TaxID=2026186 RepID=UPI001DF1921B|nr:nucleotidyltransferase domain-containing protein [Bacillus paranthracis]MBE7114429.1 nucleotidyltransferase domain-containing protein [Bacillus paranthracis]MBE7154697.1 nucleotidyltransferase domain-containing protein [Bacillus paranthracis]